MNRVVQPQSVAMDPFAKGQNAAPVMWIGALIRVPAKQQALLVESGIMFVQICCPPREFLKAPVPLELAIVAVLV